MSYICGNNTCHATRKISAPGGFSVFNLLTMHFNKTAKTIAEQIVLLKNRGLLIENEKKAADYLSNISYYRLSAYFLSFQKYNDPSHSYMPWATFNGVMQLYVFDRELRLILLDAIERIEVAIRCRIIYEYCHKHGPNWYEDSTLFIKKHAEFLTLVYKELNMSKEVFIDHYYSKYTSPPHPPAWMAMEVLSFGKLSTMYKNLKLNTAKKATAAYFGVNPIILESWMEHLVYIRNTCAHHSRLWNRIVTVKAQMPTNPAYDWIRTPPSKLDKNYTSLCVISYLLERVFNSSTFTARIRTLSYRFPDIDFVAAGFPAQWERDPFWKKTAIPQTYKLRIFYFKWIKHRRARRLLS